MLHTKFNGNRSAGSGEDFKGFLPSMGVAAILVICDQYHVNKFSFLVLKSLHAKFG